jgi:DNA-binding LacI/PurR family transcriptional regulator/signal transduction histidine kinase
MEKTPNNERIHSWNRVAFLFPKNQVKPAMEYFLKSLPRKKSRLTIGFLDENLYLKFHSQKMAGVFEVAQKYNANVIRFTDGCLSQTDYQSGWVNMVFDQIEQYQLDGLVFLGWMSSVYNDIGSFKRRFASLPLVSIGTAYPDIPNVFFPGNQYIREILSHLISVHHFKRIAYIAPNRPDSRSDTYISTMREYGIYDPNLFISEKELSDDLTERAKSSVAILLDQRRVMPEAIVSLYNMETAAVLNELKSRGLNVPKDIAVTSYEDSEISKYASPPLTTIYFPWFELGYYGCEKLVKLLTDGHVPLSTGIPGAAIYRSSCGCLSNAVQSAGNFTFEAAAVPLDKITIPQQKKIIAEMATTFPNSKLNFERLLEAFLRDFKERGHTCFLAELTLQLKNFPYGFHNFNIENLISTFRKCLLPYLVHQEDTILWSGDIFQQSQVLIWDTVSSIDGQEKASTKIFNKELLEIGQILAADFNMQNLMDSLAASLPKLQIPSCYVLIFNSIFDCEHRTDNPFDNCSLIFEYSDHTRLNPRGSQPLPAHRILSEIPAPRNTAYLFLEYLLQISDNAIGMVLFEPGPLDERIYLALAMHISIALSGAALFQKLEYSYQKHAAQAHREGMADISTEILHNFGNILNSINASVSIMKDVANSASFRDFVKANHLLAKGLNDIEVFFSEGQAGSKLFHFYLQLGISFAEIKQQLLYQIHRLNEKMNLIQEVITAQQKYAGIEGIVEELDMAAVIEDAIKLHAETLNNYQIKIVKEFQVTPKVLAERIKLFHILVNVIRNALDAMLETPEPERMLKFTVGLNNRGKFLRITDNGCGIPAPLLQKIFENGYTTKNHGNSLGLYSCAGYMAEMNGEIWAESDGPGTGATFVLQFNSAVKS